MTDYRGTVPILGNCHDKRLPHISTNQPNERKTK